MEISLPSSTPLSTRTPSPDGAAYRTRRPMEGRKPRAGSSAYTRHCAREGGGAGNKQAGALGGRDPLLGPQPAPPPARARAAAHLHGPAADVQRLRLRHRQPLARRHAQHVLHQVLPRDGLSDGVLDL